MLALQQLNLGSNAFIVEIIRMKKFHLFKISFFLGGTDQTWADCVLPINVINNIIFSLLWFWLILMLLITIYGLIQTTLRMMSFSTHAFFGHHLQTQNLYTMEESGTVINFVRKCPPDVTLILRLYEIELGKKLVGEIIAQLFLMYKNNHIFLEDLFTEHLS